MELAELQAYGYFTLIALLVFGLYSYIYHLYSVRKDVDGHDYEDYADLALHDDVTDTPVSAISKDTLEGEKDK